jgi:hypothetical protein
VIVTDVRCIELITRLTGHNFAPPYQVIGLEERGEVVAAMAFVQWTGPDVMVSVAALPGHLRRALIKAAGDYVFQQLGCCRATLITESKTALNYGTRLGAENEGRSRNQFGVGKDGYRLAFHRDAWRF